MPHCTHASLEKTTVENRNEPKPTVHSPQLSDAPASLTPAANVQPQGTAASPGLLDLINLVADKAEPLLKLISTTTDRYQKGQERQIKFQTHMAWVAVSVVFSIIAVSAWLTYVGKIDGSTFTFLLGLIVGYVLTFIRDQIKSPES